MHIHILRTLNRVLPNNHTTNNRK